MENANADSDFNIFVFFNFCEAILYQKLTTFDLIGDCITLLLSFSRPSLYLVSDLGSLGIKILDFSNP